MTQQNPSAPAGALINVPEPSDLAVAARVAQLILTEHEHTDPGDLLAVNHAHHATREALRILLRAAEQAAARRSVDAQFPAVAAFLAAERGEGQ